MSREKCMRAAAVDSIASYHLQLAEKLLREANAELMKPQGAVSCDEVYSQLLMSALPRLGEVSGLYSATKRDIGGVAWTFERAQALAEEFKYKCVRIRER